MLLYYSSVRRGFRLMQENAQLIYHAYFRSNIQRFVQIRNCWLLTDQCKNGSSANGIDGFLMINDRWILWMQMDLVPVIDGWRSPPFSPRTTPLMDSNASLWLRVSQPLKKRIVSSSTLRRFCLFFYFNFISFDFLMFYYVLFDFNLIWF